MSGKNRVLKVLAASVSALAIYGGPATVAGADFGIEPGSLLANQYDAAGEVDTRAGVHPYESVTQFDFNTIEYEGIMGPVRFPDERAKDITVDLPAGFVGDPGATPTCPRAVFYQSTIATCSPSTQVGTAALELTLASGFPPGKAKLAVYNLSPAKGQAAAFGIFVVTVPVVLNAKVNPETNAVQVTAPNINEGAVLYGQRLSLWGVPGDRSHDAERVCVESNEEGMQGEATCNYKLPLAPRPFLSNPTSCEGPQATNFAFNSWERPEHVLEYAYMPAAGATECERVPFEPSFEATPTTRAGGSPTGLAVDIHLPQTTAPGSLATGHLRDTRVVFPEGMSLSPSSADGLGSCTDAQLGFGSGAPAQCPESASIGSIEVATPVLPEGLEGSLYLRPQASMDPESGEMLRLAMVVGNEERGVLLKLPGQMRANSRTGQLEARFVENPQLPFEDLRMELKGGPRAALLTPSACGTYVTRAEFTSWARPQEPVISDSSFTIDEGCERGSEFNPGFEAGTADPVAGKHSPFSLRVTRQDGEQNVSRIEATLPEGLLAKLAGVPLCGDAAAASGGCPAQSQVGTANVGAGAGSNPLYVPQPGKAPTAAYLAGPYKGAPYSLVVKVPAQAGPFDLGTVTVRNKIEIDPVTAQVAVSSDPLPQILQGIPIAYRDVRVDIDRPGFTLNPTSCDPMAVKGTIGSNGGKSAKVESRFQVANCERLAFKPKLALKLSGKTNRSAYPALRATLTMPKGGANIARGQVTLPKTEFLEQSHIKTICTRVQYAAKSCPKASIYGYAKAWSPLLDNPLEGPVYLRSSSNPLPDLVASLDGQIHIDLAGRIDSVNARIRNTFEIVPDAPVSKFVLTMQGGKKGLLVNNTELCKAKPRAEVKFDAQNGKTADSKPLVKVDCGKKGKRKKK